VLESHFPDAEEVGSVENITEEMVQNTATSEWSLWEGALRAKEFLAGQERSIEGCQE